MFPEGSIPFKPFDGNFKVERYQTNLPHWRQVNATYFVTFRLADSIPEKVLNEWESEKVEWAQDRGLTLAPPIRAHEIPNDLRFEFSQTFNRKLNEYLDRGLGRCVLKNQSSREVVEKRLSESQSLIGDFVIIPNHVHLLMTEFDSSSLELSLKKIKGASSRFINELIGGEGSVWQKHSYDHIVRNGTHLDKYQKYILDNPKFAQLTADQYTHQGATYRDYRDCNGASTEDSNEFESTN